MSTSKGLTEDEWTNYPLDCRTRFLALTSRCPTASDGVKRHFIYPDVDDVLDDYLAFVAMFGDSPEPSAT